MWVWISRALRQSEEYIASHKTSTERNETDHTCWGNGSFKSSVIFSAWRSFSSQWQLFRSWESSGQFSSCKAARQRRQVWWGIQSITPLFSSSGETWYWKHSISRDSLTRYHGTASWLSNPFVVSLFFLKVCLTIMKIVQKSNVKEWTGACCRLCHMIPISWQHPSLHRTQKHLDYEGLFNLRCRPKSVARQLRRNYELFRLNCFISKMLRRFALSNS